MGWLKDFNLDRTIGVILVSLAVVAMLALAAIAAWKEYRGRRARIQKLGGSRACQTWFHTAAKESCDNRLRVSDGPCGAAQRGEVESEPDGDEVYPGQDTDGLVYFKLCRDGELYSFTWPDGAMHSEAWPLEAEAYESAQAFDAAYEAGMAYGAQGAFRVASQGGEVATPNGPLHVLALLYNAVKSVSVPEQGGSRPLFMYHEKLENKVRGLLGLELLPEVQVTPLVLNADQVAQGWASFDRQVTEAINKVADQVGQKIYSGYASGRYHSPGKVCPGCGGPIEFSDHFIALNGGTVFHKRCYVPTDTKL